MKNVVLGTGLLICGLLALIIVTQVGSHHNLPLGRIGFRNIGIIMFICGIVLNIIGFVKKDTLS